ncbi:hypothetical protein ACLOJK_029064 [Asimina triloba]
MDMGNKQCLHYAYELQLSAIDVSFCRISDGGGSVCRMQMGLMQLWLARSKNGENDMLGRIGMAGFGSWALLHLWSPALMEKTVDLLLEAAVVGKRRQMGAMMLASSSEKMGAAG